MNKEQAVSTRGAAWSYDSLHPSSLVLFFSIAKATANEAGFVSCFREMRILYYSNYWLTAFLDIYRSCRNMYKSSCQPMSTGNFSFQ